MRKFNNNYIQPILFVIFAFCIIVFSLLTYNSSLQADLQKSVCQTLEEVTAQQSFNFNAQISTNSNALKSLAFTITYIPHDKDLAKNTLNSIVQNTDFEYVVAADKMGNGITSDGITVNMSKYLHFNDTLTGSTVIGDPIFSVTANASLIPISHPIYKSDAVVGVLIGFCSTEKLSRSILPSFNNLGDTYVVDLNGNIIIDQCTNATQYSNSDRFNLLDELEKKDQLNKNFIKKVRYDMRDNKGSHTDLKINNTKSYLHYSPLGVNNWYIFSIVPDAIITTSSTHIVRNAIFLTVAISLMFLLFIIYLSLLQRKSTKEKLEYSAAIENYAFFDELTGLPNLTKFKLDAQQIVLKNPNINFVILKIDILNFKMINEMFGFKTGDAVVKYIANTINKIHDIDGRDYSLLCRINSDEFLIFDEFSSLNDLAGRTKFFDDLFSVEMSEILHYHKITFRFGRYFFDEGETDIVGAIEKANMAHKMSKQFKGTPICDYDMSFKNRVIYETEIENNMEAALLNNEFVIYLQPKYELLNEKVVGAEALVRWKKPDGSIIPPGNFIPLFERNGFITNLDMYVLSQVCKLIGTWIEKGLPIVTVSVNFSRLHLSNDHFVHELERITSRYNIPNKYIEIELTETVIFDNESVFSDLLYKLHLAGFTLSMDDFGTGYSSLGLLKNLAVDVIKIDKTFFTDIKYGLRSKLVLESVIQMAKKLDIYTVAEGVENKEHILLLKEVGCDIVQGYYYARPFPAEEFFTQSPPLEISGSVINR